MPATPPHPRQVASLLGRAARFLKESRPADAVGPLREAALLQPSNSIIQHDLGLALLEIGHAADAISAFHRAIATSPRYTDAYFRMGIALEKLGDLRGAVRAYNRATEL